MKDNINKNVSEPYVRYPSSIFYLDNGNVKVLVRPEPFSYISNDGEKVTIPPHVEYIGTGKKEKVIYPLDDYVNFLINRMVKILFGALEQGRKLNLDNELEYWVMIICRFYEVSSASPKDVYRFSKEAEKFSLEELYLLRK